MIANQPFGGTGHESTRTIFGAAALARVGLAPLALEPKEGLALLNGTQLMAGIAALVLHDGQRLAASAEAFFIELPYALEQIREATHERLAASIREGNPDQAATTRTGALRWTSVVRGFLARRPAVRIA